MAISVVQGTSGSIITGGGSSFTISMASNVTAGNFIIIVTANDDAPGTQGPYSDAGGNHYDRVFTTGDGGGGNGIEVYIAYLSQGGFKNITVGVTGFDNVAATAYEVSGLALYSSFDAGTFSKKYQTANPIASNSLTTVMPNELLIAISFDNSTTPGTWTDNGSGWGNLQQNTTQQFTGLATETKIVSATGSYSSQITDNTSASPFGTAWVVGFADTPIQSHNSLLYLLNTTNIKHPASIDTGTKSAVLPAGTDHSPAATTALDMDVNANLGITNTDTTTTSTTGTSAVLTSARHHSWVSKPLGGTGIIAGNWTIGFAWAENNAAANQFMALSIYVLKPDGTVRGYVYDATTQLDVEFNTAEGGILATVSGSAVNSVGRDDQLVIEVWTTGTQTGTTSRTITSHWNGRDKPIDQNAINSSASYVLAPQNLFTPNDEPWNLPIPIPGPVARRQFVLRQRQAYSALMYQSAASGPVMNTLNLSAALTFTGALTKQTNKGLTANLTFTGSLIKQTNHLLTATLSFSGAVLRQTGKQLAAGLSFTGAIKKAITHSLSAGLSFTGSLIKAVSHSLSAGLSFSGNLVWQFNRSVSASLSFTGSKLLQTGKALAATLTFTGALSRSVSKLLSAALTFTGAIKKSVSHNLTAGLSFTGSLIKSIGKGLAGGLSFTGAITAIKVSLVSLSAALSFTGSIQKSVGKVLSAGLTFTGSIKKSVGHLLSAGLSFTGSLIKQVNHSLSAVLSFTGALTPSKLAFLSLNATLSFSGSIKKQVGKALSGGLSFTGSLLKQTLHSLTAGLSFTGAFLKTPQKALAGGLSFSGATSRQVGKQLIGSLSFVRTNVVTNPNFEADTPGNGNTPALWGSYNSAGTQTYKGVANDFAEYGSNSYKIAASGNTDTGINITFNAPAGSTWTLSAWVKTDASVVNASLVLANGSNNDHNALNIGANQNGRFYVTYTVQVASNVQIFLGLGSFGAQSPGTVWYDGIMLERTDQHGSYFDGATGGGTWLGSANASASVLYETTLIKSVGKNLSGGLTFSGALTKQISKSFSASLSFVGAIAKQVRKPLSATLSFTGSVGRRIAKVLTATLIFTGNLSVARAVLLSFSAALSFTGNLLTHVAQKFHRSNPKYLANKPETITLNSNPTDISLGQRPSTIDLSQAPTSKQLDQNPDDGHL